jgi:hypothetical protein
MKLLKTLVISHAGYIFITALWPLIDIDSFMKVTGPKTDIWLVKTVGALLTPVSVCMLSFLWVRGSRAPLVILGAGISAAFIIVDLVYSLQGIISPIYLADAFIELLFAGTWIYMLTRVRII